MYLQIAQRSPRMIAAMNCVKHDRLDLDLRKHQFMGEIASLMSPQRSACHHCLGREGNRTRANANENSLPSHNGILVVRFGMVAGTRSLFDRSAAGRHLEKSAEARLEFIGIPPRVVGGDFTATCGY